ncbi:LarC family nickel insertion protein [Paraglaciecola sp.]|uniref:LarC family nickel insertion protein n=1 Tax=Paraglaciecola sp. TaxID=1920173 RepID=UPI003EF0AB3E
MTLNVKKYHIHLDIVGGIAGDMFIAAMLDTFPELKSEVLTAIATVLPASAGTPTLTEGLNSGISGLRFSLITTKDTSTESQHHHHHSHSHHQDASEHSHSHTTYKHLCGLISKSALKEDVKQGAIDILTIIAHAEAKIHAKTLADVHFHELADWDSLMDVVASAVIFDALKLHTWSISPLPIGGGLVKTQHGLIPVPAPATAEILAGFTFFDDGVQGERITPTGAAILRYLSDKKCLTTRKQGQLQQIGYGLGTKVFPSMPNILRATSFCQLEDELQQQDTVVVIEFDIDDMTGEELAHSLDLLRQYTGVVDVVVQSARGKKNRAVELVRILASTEYYQDIIDYCFIQTSTIGLRYRFETRNYLARTLTNQTGQAYKTVTRPDGSQTTKVEHDELTSLSTLNERRMFKYNLESEK